MTNKFIFETDLVAKTIHIVREFNAPVEKVWKAFTDPAVLVKWMTPKPWTAEIKTFDLTVGGTYLYAMVGTEGPKHWTRMEFTAIEDGSSFSATGMFSDEDGNAVPDGPRSFRVIKFSPIEGDRTEVDTMISFNDEAVFKWFVEGGFKDGTAMTLNQLDELLAAE